MVDAEKLKNAKWGVRDDDSGDIIALCPSQQHAEVIARALAALDPVRDSYTALSLVTGNGFVEGGGHYIKYKMERNEVC